MLMVVRVIQSAIATPAMTAGVVRMTANDSLKLGSWPPGQEDDQYRDTRPVVSPSNNSRIGATCPRRATVTFAGGPRRFHRLLTWSIARPRSSPLMFAPSVNMRCML